MKDYSYVNDPNWIEKEIQGCKREIKMLAESIKKHDERIKKIAEKNAGKRPEVIKKGEYHEDRD